MTEITINPEALLVALYTGFKLFAALWISFREVRNPIWNSEGDPVPREFHHILGLVTRNCIINPEWGTLKMIAFVPVFLVTGKRYLRFFVPWRIPKAPPACRICKDKGRYFVKPFITGFADVRTGKVQGKRKGVWEVCECQNEQPGREQLSEMRLATSGFATAEHRRSAFSFRYLDADDPFCGENKVPFCWTSKVPFYWTSKVPFCWKTPKDHTRLRIGEIVTMGSVRKGHRHAYLLGRPLKILALNLPFAVVEQKAEYAQLDAYLKILALNLPFAVVEQKAEYAQLDAYRLRTNYKGSCGQISTWPPATTITTVNFRGMILHGDSELGWSPYHPLLEPTDLKVGDKFVLMRLGRRLGSGSMPTDGSYRGEAFRVVKSAHRLTESTMSKQAGTLVLACEHLSFYKFATYLECEDLQIIAANDHYIRATDMA